MTGPIWRLSYLINISRVFYRTGINEYNVDGIKTIHAEVNASKKVKKSDNIKKIIFVVYRTNKTGTSLLCSKPCKHCLKTAFFSLKKKNYIIDRLYFFNKYHKLSFYNNRTIMDILNL